MKKILATMLAILMIATSVLTFASCFGAKPEMDFAKIEEKYKDNEDVYVNYVKDADKLDANVEEKISVTKKIGSGDDVDSVYLSITRYKDTKSAKLAYEQLKISQDASKQLYKNYLKEAQYILDNYSDKLSSDEIDSYKEDIKEYEDALEKIENSTFGRSGKVVWSGDKDLIKETK